MSDAEVGGGCRGPGWGEPFQRADGRSVGTVAEDRFPGCSFAGDGATRNDDAEALVEESRALPSAATGPLAKPRQILVTPDLPKT